MMDEPMRDEPTQCYRVSSSFRMLGSLPIEDVELYLTVCGTERCSADKFYGPIVRRDYHVHFILSGKGTLEMGGKVYHLHRGQIFVTVPGIEIFYYSDPENPWHYAHAKISDIASYIGITRSYLTHIFKQKMEISPQEYLVSYRLEQGSRLLRTTRMSIGEIAEKIGYENPLTFSKIFKNVYGVSPKNYRLRVLKQEQQIFQKG